MFDPTTFAAFLAASIAIILAPGPAQALVLSRSIGQGRRAGILTAVGLNAGTIAHSAAAALGLSAVLATSALAFEIVKYLGAAYLVYLGVHELRTGSRTTPAARAANANASQTFGKAVLTGILNPKVALFFLAFLPQFVDPARGSIVLQFMLLGCTLAALDVLYESGLALVAGTLSGRLARSARFATWQARVSGLVMIGLGVRLALVSRE